MKNNKTRAAFAARFPLFAKKKNFFPALLTKVRLRLIARRKIFACLALYTAKGSVLYAEERIHFLCRIFINAACMMQQYVIRLFYFSRGFKTKAAHGAASENTHTGEQIVT